MTTDNITTRLTRLGFSLLALHLFATSLGEFLAPQAHITLYLIDFTPWVFGLVGIGWAFVIALLAACAIRQEFLRTLPQGPHRGNGTSGAGVAEWDETLNEILAGK